MADFVQNSLETLDLPVLQLAATSITLSGYERYLGNLLRVHPLHEVWRPKD
jgi:hypothetical protein